MKPCSRAGSWNVEELVAVEHRQAEIGQGGGCGINGTRQRPPNAKQFGLRAQEGPCRLLLRRPRRSGQGQSIGTVNLLVHIGTALAQQSGGQRLALLLEEWSV